jgi:hypothetical protein
MRKKITVTRTLTTLIEAKKRMDENKFNSYSFRIEYPEWGAFCSILKKNGVIEKSRMKNTWISIEPNLHMAEKVLSVYHQKTIIARNNYISKKAEKTDEIIEEISELSFYRSENSTEPKTTHPTLQIPEFENIVKEPENLTRFDVVSEFNKLEKLNFENERLIENQKETIKKQDEKLVNQFSYISDLEEIMEHYKKDIDTIEKEFVELKKSISHQNNLFIKPNSKKIKIFGIPLYSVEY